MGIAPPILIGMIGSISLESEASHWLLIYRRGPIRRKDVRRLRELRIAEAWAVLIGMLAAELARNFNFDSLSQSISFTLAAVWLILAINPDMIVSTRKIIHTWHQGRSPKE